MNGLLYQACFDWADLLAVVFIVLGMAACYLLIKAGRKQ